MKTSLTFFCILFLNISLLAQTDTPTESSTDSRSSINSSLLKVNNRLKTHDNGYYKRIDFDGTYIINTVSIGTRKIAINDIEDVTFNDDMTKINCKSDDCVIWDDGDTNDSMGFAYTENDDPYALVRELKDLIRAIKEKGGSTSGADRALQRINDYFVNFDNGFYGTLSYDNKYIYNDIPGSGRRRIPIKEIRDVRIVGNAVRYTCKNGSECAMGSDQGSYYDAMGFSSNLDYDAEYFADLLRDLLTALR